MTAVLVTIDTELSPAAHGRGVSAEENLRCAILGRVSDGEWGIEFQIARFKEHSLKAVFFVEALSANVVGLDLLKRTIEPILSAGHEVQLHIHTEWLEWFSSDPVSGHRGQNIGDFSYDDQRRLIQIGVENLEGAGAPRPIAFRAGNYGANNGTLRALASEAITYDSSYNFSYLGHPCRIATAPPPLNPIRLDGTIEIPISTFADFPGHQRPAQLCAISTSEMQHLLKQYVEQDRRSAVIVSHSFELLNSTRTRSNPIVVRRFRRLCEMLASIRPNVGTVGFVDLDESILTAPTRHALPLQSATWRTGLRVMEQAAGAMLFG
jgi:peptidoglycan/xylan/chitin deacetylase (PgdA/CDA1 family)